MNSQKNHTRPITPSLDTRHQLEQIQEERDQLIARLHEANEKNISINEENRYLKKQCHQLNQDLINAGDTSTHLEHQVLTHEQEIIRLTKKNQELLKSKRETKKKLDLESEEFEIERNQWSEKVLTLNKKIKTLLSNQSRVSPQVSRVSPRSNITKTTSQVIEHDHSRDLPCHISSDTPPGSPLPKKKPKQQPQLEELKKTIRQRDNVIFKLREKLEEITNQRNLLEQRDLSRTDQMEQLLVEKNQLREMNLTLMEENESFQMLLHEKTISGNFTLNRGLQSPPDTSEDEEIELKLGINSCSTLAAELLHSAPPSPGFSETEEDSPDSEFKKLREEIRVLRDENKGLTLYVNKILTRIMESGKLEEVLASDYQDPDPRASSTLDVPPTITVTPVALRVRSNTLVGKTSSENDVDLMTESLAIARARRSNTVSTNSNPITGFRAAWKRMSGATWIAKPNS